MLAERLLENLKVNGESKRSEGIRPLGDTNGLLHEINPRRELSELILPPTVESACLELIEEQCRAELLRSHALEPRHRILLSGPPGNGKTTLAEAIASALLVPLLVVRYDGIIASYLGETAVRIARVFDAARSQRCVLFFDEFDAVGKERGDIHETGEIKRVVSSLLLQVDALPSHVVIVTATNHAELLDRAAWRRFQLRLQLPMPTRDQAAEWLRRFEARVGLAFGYSVRTLAERLKGLSFAELEEFASDVHRRYILTTPGGDVRSITAERLAQWEARSGPTA